MGYIIEIDKFVINQVVFFLGPFGKDPGNDSRDIGGVYGPHDADTLVSFLYIEFIHEFVGFDGVPDALV